MSDGPFEAARASRARAVMLSTVCSVVMSDGPFEAWVGERKAHHAKRVCSVVMSDGPFEAPDLSWESSPSIRPLFRRDERRPL